ncbi:MAG: Gfo/Idh/MocA family oxidoreductase [Clostridia bacterium]|nr:Gfo/Idh/MocA family oxidoreductase [Clostridia bacterium]
MSTACIIGYGAIGPVHAKALEKIGINYYVCDCNPEKLKLAGEKGIYNSIDECLSDTKADVVHICLPHHMHVSVAEAAIAAGKKVVLEKPVGINRKEVNRLFDRYSDEICIILQNRKNPCAQRLKEIISNEVYGKVKSACAFLTWSRDREYYESEEWRGKWSTEGGGLMINQAVHTLDLLCWLGGGYKSLKGGISNRKLGGIIEVEDTADMVIALNSGIDACFYATNCSQTSAAPRIEFECEKGTLRYGNNMLILISKDNVSILEYDSTEVPGKSYWGRGHESVIREYYDYLDGKTDSFFNLGIAKDAMNALFDLYESR